MPYEVKGKCIYKKDGGAKVGCTKGSVNKYLAALHANADEAIESKETITELYNEMDTVKMDIPFLIRVMEYAKEDAKSDMDLHKATERMVSLSKEGKTLTMDNYNSIFGGEQASESIKINENTKPLIKHLIRKNFNF